MDFKIVEGFDVSTVFSRHIIIRLVYLYISLDFSLLVMYLCCVTHWDRHLFPNGQRKDTRIVIISLYVKLVLINIMFYQYSTSTDIKRHIFLNYF